MVQTGTKVKLLQHCTVWYVCNIHHVWLDSINTFIIHSKYFPILIGKSTRIIHHDQLLNCHIEQSY